MRLGRQGEEPMKTARIVMASLLVIAVMGASLMLTGCEKAAEQASEALVEGATGVDVDADENKVTIEGEDGSTVEIQSSDAELPDGFPDDVPVYDAAIESSSKFSADGGTSYAVSQTTGDDFDDVLAWFKAELADSGWSESGSTSSESDGAKFGLIAATKGGNELSVGVQSEDGSETQITLTVVSEE